MNDWRDLKLGEVLTLQRGFDIRRASQRAGSIPVVSSSGIGSYHDTAMAQGPGVVIGRKGSLGTCFFLKEAYWPHDTTLWVREFKGNDPHFCYFLLKSLDLAKFDVGSANPTLNRNHVHLLDVRCPSLPKQRRIASILGVYDELIDVNRRRIAALEEMSRRLFDEWFFGFRFPGHESARITDTPDGPLPAGWTYLGLHQVAEVAFGFPFKSPRFNKERVGTPVVRIRDILEGRSETYTDEQFEPHYDVKDGDLLVGMDGIFHTAIWSGGEAALNQRVTRLRPRDNRSAGWLLLSILPKIKHLEATISGTTVAHLSARDLKAMRVLTPTGDIQVLADRNFKAFDLATVNYRHQQRRLGTCQRF
jgi:type I restriction enzyme S subunit